VTDRDLRDRVLAVKGDPLGPVGAIASRLLGQVPHDANVFDVMALLVESGLRHLPVTREGRIVGVVTDTDILRRQSGSPLLLHSVLQRAHDPGGIASWVRLAAAAIVGMNDDGIGAVNVGRMSSLAADLLLRRLVADATARLGAAPAAWAWLATGAEGRREAFWPSSRAGFVLFEEGASAGMVRWCADLAAQVSAGLLAAGLRPAIAAPCPADSGGMGPASAVLIDAIVRDHFLLLPALLDARPVAGSMNPGPFLKELRDAARAAVLTGRQVLKGLHRPPKGFFHDEVLEAGGTIADRLDLDARCLRLLVVLARVVAVRGGIAATSTPERLVASADAGVLSRELAMDLAASWEFVAGLCLRTGWAAKAQGECLLVPDSLSPTDRRLLKDVFSVIGEGLSSIFGDLSAAEDPWTN
jgi:CBS domain-containing protein